MLQQTVRESTGGTSHIEASFVSWRYAEIFEPAFEFQSTAARIAQVVTGQLYECIGREARTGLIHRLAVYANVSCQEHGVRPLA
jgi:hypothetical protein